MEKTDERIENKEPIILQENDIVIIPRDIFLNIYCYIDKENLRSFSSESSNIIAMIEKGSDILFSGEKIILQK